MIAQYRVEHRGTEYKMTVVIDDRYRYVMLANRSGSNNNGEWLRLAVDHESIAWSYLKEKMPELAKHPGDKEGWVMVFKMAGIEVFG
jgi:hypothetical protein